MNKNAESPFSASEVTEQLSPARIWTPSLPDFPRIECAAIAGKVVLLAAVGLAVLSVCIGAVAGVRGGVATGVVTVAITVLLYRMSTTAKTAEIPAHVEDVALTLQRGHEDAQGYVEFLNTRGLSDLSDVMRGGGITRTKVFEYRDYSPPASCVALVSGISHLLLASSAETWVRYAARRDEILWEAEQLVLLRLWASRSKRPSAARLEEWVEQNGRRSPGMAAYVRSLIPLAAQGDAAVADEWRRREEERRRRAAGPPPKTPEELERERELAERARALWDQITAANRARHDAERYEARKQRDNELGVATRKVAALNEARQDLLSRGEYRQADYVAAEQLQWQQAIDEFKRDHNL